MSPKPSLASVLGPKKAPAEESAAVEEYSAAVDELADALGVPEAKRATFADAFEAAVRGCK